MKSNHRTCAPQRFRARSSRGQSSITDALFFLLVCSLLTALLFFFGTRYGESVHTQSLYAYQNDFAKSALKTLMYSSVPRHAGEELSAADTVEIDYLFPLLKEDIARNNIVKDALPPIRDNIEGVLRPFVGAFDYMVYIYVPSQGHFPFMMIHRSVFAASSNPEDYGFGRDAAISATRDELLVCYPTGVSTSARGYCLSPDGVPLPSLTRKDLCNDPNSWRDVVVLDDTQAISRFRNTTGRVFDSTTFLQLYLPESSTTGAPIGNVGDAKAAIIELLLWNPTNIPTDILSGASGLNCYCDQVLLPSVGYWKDCEATDTDLPLLPRT